MEKRYARLKDNCILRGWTDLPYGISNQDTGLLKEVGKDIFYVLNSCDGITNFNSPAFLEGHRKILDRLILQKLVEECSEDHVISEVQKYRKAENPLIREVHWAITGNCNMNCRHCFMESPKGKYGCQEWSVVEKFLEMFTKANVLQVSLTGGEPLISPDFLKIVEYLGKEKIRLTEIATNGCLITEDLLEKIKKTGAKPDLKISFDGLGVHDKIRGTQDMEEKVIEGIRIGVNSGFNVSVSTTVERDNISSLKDTLKLIKDLKVDVWLLGRSQSLGNWKGNPNFIDSLEMTEIFSDLLELWKKENQPCFILLERFFAGGPFIEAKDYVGKRDRKHQIKLYTKDSFECDSLREKPFLLPDGTLIPCIGFTGTSIQADMPNLLNQNLSDIWRESSLRDFIDAKKDIVLERNLECQFCEYFESCGAGCRAYALSENGFLFDRDPIVCDMYKKGYKKKFAEMYLGVENNAKTYTKEGI